MLVIVIPLAMPLHLGGLPPHTTRRTIVRLLVQVGGLDRRQIGQVELLGREAVVEVRESELNRVVAAVDGANLENRHIRAWREGGQEGNNAAGESESHFQRLTRLLQLEGAAEAERAVQLAAAARGSDAEVTGHCLLNLVVLETTTGLGRRLIATLTRRQADQPLPWNRLGAGTPVRLSRMTSSSGESWRGVVSRQQATRIEVALDSDPLEVGDDSGFRLDLAHDEVGLRRQLHALQRAEGARGDRLAHLRSVLMGQTAAKTASAVPAWEPLNPKLNASQRAAVESALAAQDVAIIHGPPGTGKTTAVVELIRQAVARGEKVLACAPSNQAVDNVFERLVTAGENAVRLGHPARVQPALRDHTLDLMVQAHPDVKLARKLVREAGTLRARAERQTRAKPAPGQRRELREEARQLVADARRIQAQVVAEILDRAAVLCATLTGLDSEVLGQRSFDLVVIDEACQSIEPSCWIPLTRADRVVLAGDHCQLPPTVISSEAAGSGFGVSLMERLVDQLGDSITRRLETQYRMNAVIMAFSSGEFYEGSLVADGGVADHVLAGPDGLDGVAMTPATSKPIGFIDTAGAGYDEEREPDGDSRRNPDEARRVILEVDSLRQAGLAADQVAVITPYAAQVRLLRSLIDWPGLEIDSVDGFQGREKEAIVISLVRSNPENQIGFLGDIRRMNVAWTRARRRLVVIGDSATVAAHPFYRRMIEFFELNDAYGTVWE